MRLLVLIIGILSICKPVFSESLKKNVGILKFESRSTSSMEVDGIYDLFTVGLVNSDAFRVLDRANMSRILEEQAFQNSGCTDQECAVEIGKILNMDYIFIGTVFTLNSSLYITINMVSVETGEILKSAKTTGFSPTKINSKVNKLVNYFGKDYITKRRSPKSKLIGMASKRKNTNSYKKVKPNKKALKNVLGILSLTFVSATVAFPVAGYVNFKEHQAAYENTTEHFQNYWFNYSRSEYTRNQLYRVGIGTGIVSSILTVLFFTINPKKKKPIELHTNFNNKGVQFSLVYNY